jgi:nicotinamide mononucleotide (NMN) deamidase PncC
MAPMSKPCDSGQPRRVAAALTDIPGSSAWFERGYVTYSGASYRRVERINSRAAAAR